MISRRELLKTSAAAAIAQAASSVYAQPADTERVHETALEAVRQLKGSGDVRLRLIYPAGCVENVRPAVSAFTDATGVAIELFEVPLDEITEELLIEARARSGSFDIAIPATFGLPDLVEAGILVDLDRYAERHEPAGFHDDALFSHGDYYKGNLYGYQTDGDTYLMFYLKDWLDNADEQKRFADQHGYALTIPSTWNELDTMMAYFHRPSEGKYGGALFRTEFFIAWEWWVRFHAKGFFPFDDQLNPQLNNDGGIEALEELVAASRHLYPGANSNGLFENFQAFGRGDSFCNIGWGGTQKYLNSSTSKVRNRLAFGPTPGGIINGQLVRTPYFNWGWNYVVSSTSAFPEIAYLFTLFASSPKMSIASVREPGGYFDPFRGGHYNDSVVRQSYSPEFLAAHEDSMRNSIPDLYLKGQVEYFDELRLNVKAADAGTKTPKQALDDTVSAWNAITERMGKRSQIVQWLYLKSTYPPSVRQMLV